jgi:hypothetical protein
MKIELIIKKDNLPDSWYQAYLIVGNTEEREIDRSFYDYDDCRINAEKIVEDFAKQGIYILHNKIYDLMP